MRAIVKRQELVCDRCHTSTIIPEDAPSHAYDWYTTPEDENDLCPKCASCYEAVMRCLDAYMNSFAGTADENQPADLLADITAALKKV